MHVKVYFMSMKLILGGNSEIDVIVRSNLIYLTLSCMGDFTDP